MSLNKVITIDELNNSIDILNRIYDSTRIVHPLKKKIISLIDGNLFETQNNCFNNWPKGKVCDNCISMRAINEKDIFFKLEWAGRNIFMVMAVPVQDGTETFVLELLKDITNSMTLDRQEASKDVPLLKTLYETGQLQIKDSLTGLFNRRYIFERLPSDILNADADSSPLAVIFADIDHFKNVNDTHGHVAGDYILREFAELLQKGLGGSDGWAARYGGEEFLLIIRNLSMALVVNLAEKLRKEIEGTEFKYEEKIIKITSSFGIIALNKSFDIKPEELIDRADKNLYASKQSGRNKVTASEL